MSNNTPAISCYKLIPALTVGNIQEAVEFYTQKLGFAHDFFWGDPPDMAGINLDGASMHLFEGKPEGKSTSVYFIVGSADELYEYHRSNGVEIVAEPQNKPYDMRDYHIRDPYGNYLGFGHWIPSKEPALKIERVNVPVRLEKRLAALLSDLAEHKGMSIDSTLEEMLLHTFETVGEGVASPHTKATLRYIQHLKQKHGIDYDVHASYRFVE